MGGGWKKVFLPAFLSLNPCFIPRTSKPPIVFDPNQQDIFHPVVMHMNEIQTIERLIPYDGQMLFPTKTSAHESGKQPMPNQKLTIQTLFAVEASSFNQRNVSMSTVTL